MTTLRERLGIARSGSHREGGMTLIEVVVAMMILTIVSTGVLYTMMTMLTVTRDTRSRQVAINLAAEEIDRARSVENVSDLVGWTTDSGDDDPNDPLVRKGVVVVNGDNFHIRRSVQWVSDPDSQLSCGASASQTTLRYKRVNVSVTWDGMRDGALAARADTLINPRGMVNDPTKGALLVSVVDSFGNGTPGVTVTVTPAPGVTANLTDADGCTYLINVNPNSNYTIRVSKSGFLNEQQVAAPSATGIAVTAGFTNSRTFQLARAGVYNLTYPAARPVNFKTSFISTERTYVATIPAASSASLFPVNYKVVAGDSIVCPASNPANWTLGDDGNDPATPLVPTDVQGYTAAPGGSVSVPVVTGQVQVSGVSSSKAIRAVSTTGSGHPACTAETTYDYPAGQNKISLPFGSWKLSLINATGTASPAALAADKLTLLSYGKIATNGTVTVDPRILSGAEE